MMNYASATPDPVEERKAKYKHVCPWTQCERRFTCPHNVQQHIKEKHTNERDQRCNQCPAAFTRPFALNRHMDKVHGIRIGPGRGNTKRKQVNVSSATPTPSVQIGFEEADRDLLRDASVEDLSRLPVSDDFDFNAPVTLPDSRSTKNITDNFAYSLTSCYFCLAVFNSSEEVLIHLHNVHDQPISPFCNCTMCSGGLAEAPLLTSDRRLRTSGADLRSVPVSAYSGGQLAPAEQVQPSVWTQDMEPMSTSAYKPDDHDATFGGLFESDLSTNGTAAKNGTTHSWFSDTKIAEAEELLSRL